MANNVVEARGIARRYGDTLALSQTDLDIKEGLTSIYGESGSGKSSLLAILACVEKPDTGLVRHFQDEALVIANSFRKDKRGERKAREKGMRNHTAFVPQRPALNPSQTIRDNINQLLAVRSIKKVPDLELVIDGLGLSEYWDRYPKEVSGGQCQRAALAAALLVAPRVLFLDEVTSALDTGNAQSTYDLLKHYTVEQEMTVVLASHDANAKSYADHVITLSDGRITGNITVASDMPSLAVPVVITFPYLPTTL